jgi:hypothetical protein
MHALKYLVPLAVTRVGLVGSRIPLDRSVPAQVGSGSVRPGSIACRAPAPSDSDLARPAPDQPLTGLIAQSCVLLRPGSAACGACWIPLRPTRVQPAWLRINHVLACWLKRGSGSCLDQLWCFCAPVSSDSDTARPAPDILVLA